MDSRRSPLYAFVVSRGARIVGVLAAALAAGVVLVAAGATIAANPASSSVTVPTTVGQTETREWTGEIPAGANPTNSCAGMPAELTDEHTVSITVPDGAYNTVNATFTFTITWPDATDDEILTVLDPDGLEIASSDGGTNQETVVATNLSSGMYTAEIGRAHV